MNIGTFLNENKLSDIKDRTMENPFKVYKPLDQGNSKLHKSIFSFSLLPVVTCPVICAGCYDVKSLRYESVRLKRLYNTHLALNDISTLKSLIIKQINNSKSIEFIRIHVGGDFFSLEYLNMWLEIKKWISENKPSIKVYTYTKTIHTRALLECGINVIESILPNGKLNFDTLENLETFTSGNPEYSICPAYKKDPSIICGKTCKLCMNKTKVLFVKH